jgi:hypothetical protein
MFESHATLELMFDLHGDLNRSPSLACIARHGQAVQTQGSHLPAHVKVIDLSMTYPPIRVNLPIRGELMAWGARLDTDETILRPFSRRRGRYHCGVEWLLSVIIRNFWPNRLRARQIYGIDSAEALMYSLLW